MSALFLAVGHFFIRKENVKAHRACMLGAFVTSTLFLISYILYHFYHGSTAFQGEGWIRPVYYLILVSHTTLALAIVPLALLTLFRALRNEIEKHRKIALWTYPIWIYVSVTGVLVYFLLYRIYPKG